MSDRDDSALIVVTGAAGFIGSHLVDRLLAEGQRVVGVDNFSDFYDRALKEANLAEARQNAGFQLEEADIRDAEAMTTLFQTHRPATVVHLAAMAGVRPSIADPTTYTAVNVDGTVNLLNAAVGIGVERFIFASSSSVYGNNEKVPFAEADAVDYPISPYAATKKAGEVVCHPYWHLYGLPITCLRFFTVFGPRQRPDLAIAKFLRCARDDEPIAMFGDGSSSRDYTYIDDIIAGVRAAMRHTSPATGYRVYNLGGSEPVSLREMIATIERVTGKELRIEQQSTQPGDVNRTWADLTRVHQALGYQPTTSLEAGIAAQWQWMANQRGGT
jgi:UDP-glucuronate 4-epimerase